MRLSFTLALQCTIVSIYLVLIHLLGGLMAGDLRSGHLSSNPTEVPLRLDFKTSLFTSTSTFLQRKRHTHTPNA